MNRGVPQERSVARLERAVTTIMKQKLLSVLLTLALALTALPLVAAPQAQAAGRWISAWGTSIVNGSVSIPGLELRDYIPSFSTIRVEIPVTAAGRASSRVRYASPVQRIPIHAPTTGRNRVMRGRAASSQP